MLLAQYQPQFLDATVTPQSETVIPTKNFSFFSTHKACPSTSNRITEKDGPVIKRLSLSAIPSELHEGTVNLRTNLLIYHLIPSHKQYQLALAPDKIDLAVVV